MHQLVCRKGHCTDFFSSFDRVTAVLQINKACVGLDESDGRASCCCGSYCNMHSVYCCHTFAEASDTTHGAAGAYTQPGLCWNTCHAQSCSARSWARGRRSWHLGSSVWQHTCWRRLWPKPQQASRGLSWRRCQGVPCGVGSLAFACSLQVKLHQLLYMSCSVSLWAPYCCLLPAIHASCAAYYARARAHSMQIGDS